MKCQNHPDLEASTRCAGCAEPFCPSCSVEIGGQTYCGACKSLALGGREPRLLAANEPYPEAGSAIKYAIAGFLIFGIILGPVAIAKASAARTVIKDNPNLLGWGKATAGLWLGLVTLLLALLNLIGRLKGTS